MRIGARLLLAVGLAAAFMPPAFGDVVYLKDGTQLEGKLEKTRDGYDVIGDGGKVTKIPADKVKSVEVKPPSTDDEAEKRLASLRRSVQALDNITQIITRYQEFLNRYGDSPVSEQARQDLVLWMDRADRNMVKAADKWVTAEELSAIREKARATVAQARDLIGEGRLREAVPLIEEALRQEPKNAAAFYLRGLLHYRQDQIAPARRAFEAVTPLIPDHAPTLNNLGVILSRLEQHVGALKFFDQAMLASPVDARILDNVAEALNALPADLRGQAVTKKAVQHFQEQDELLQQKMEQRGLFRWGSTWVDSSEMDKLQAAEKEIEDKISVIEAEFRDTQTRARQIEDDIEDTKRSMRRIEASSYVQDSITGRYYRQVYPRVYYELQQDLQDLRTDHDRSVARLDDLRREAKEVQRQLPKPRYTGLRQMIGVEGAPLFETNAGEAMQPTSATDAHDNRQP